MLLITKEPSGVAMPSPSCRTQITLRMSARHKSLRVRWWPAKNSLIWDRRGFLSSEAGLDTAFPSLRLYLFIFSGD